MRELILITLYVICAFLPVLYQRFNRKSVMTAGLFWTSWLISLVGAFTGGFLGAIGLSHIEIGGGLLIDVIPALLGAALFTGLFYKLREIPENW